MRTVELIRPVLPSGIDRREALRYLGVQGAADAATLSLLDKAEEELFRAVRPLAAVVRLRREEAELEGSGRDLERHLQNCKEVLYLGLTLGAQADMLLRRLSATNVAAAVAADALAGVLVDDLCDAVETVQRARLQEEGLYLTGRYSPGYGDCPLSLQRELFAKLDASRKIGLTLTGDLLMTPRKSVTAVLGIAPEPATGFRAGCGHCVLRDKCGFRKRGMTCDSEGNA